MKGIIIILLVAAATTYGESITREDYECNIEKYADALNEDGVWLQWDVKDVDIPINAVYGGYDSNGTYYVMRADIREENGHHAFKIVGKYDPLRKYAAVGYNDKVHVVQTFELLLHNSSTWSAQEDERALIPGSKNSLICRFEEDYVKHWIPGRLTSSKYCRISSDNAEMVSPGFESLKKACSGRVTIKPRPAEPLVVSHEEIEDNLHSYRQTLSEDGVWVYWNHNKIGVPPNAVFGGHTKQGPAYIMMADHFLADGTYAGRIPGVYFPEPRIALINYKGQQIKKKTFELLLHDSYRWAIYRDHENVMIPAGEDLAYCSKGAEVGWWDERHPGVLDVKTNNCTIMYEDRIETFSYGYFVLRRAC